jgi:outer membrane lipoprotein SlyB
MQGKYGMLYPLMVIAAVSVILLSVIGIATMTGHLPSAFSQKMDAVQQADPSDGKSSAAPTAPVPSASNADTPAPPARQAIVGSTNRTAAAAHRQAVVCGNCGVVESVTAEEIKGQGSGLGAITGGVVGAVLGHQIGSGRGRDVATVAGVVGGGVAGNEIEKNVKKSKRYLIRVHMEDGSTRVVTETVAPALSTGQRVRVEGDSVVVAS